MNASQKRLFEAARKRNPNIKIPSENQSTRELTDDDLALIKQMTDLAVDSALAGTPGVIGNDEENGDALSVIAFDRIKGGKPFDISQQWYLDLLEGIGQPAPVAAPPAKH